MGVSSRKRDIIKYFLYLFGIMLTLGTTGFFIVTLIYTYIIK